MQTRTYSIVYLKNGKKEELSCSVFSLKKFLNILKGDGAKILEIIPHQLENKKPKIIDENKIDKQRYYNSTYTYFHRRYIKGIINKKTFNEIIEVLKQLKSESSTKKEFEKKFEIYKKNTNYYTDI